MGKILTIIGARPQFIKAAPVARALRKLGIIEVTVHTGQHFDPMMSEVFFRELEISAPAYNLHIGGLGHGAMTGRMIEKLEEVIKAEKPCFVLVYGDTNSTLAGALAAAKLQIPIAHIEAGLRSFNKSMPEEINRVLTDHLSTLLFCPTARSITNLLAEGISAGVHNVGDVMYDTALEAADRAEKQSKILERLILAPKTYAVCTLHRAENTDDFSRFRALVAWLEDAARSTRIVMPVHPRTQALIAREQLSSTAIQLIEPLGYLDMTRLVSQAAVIFTDSGGLQKEAYFHRVPCVTLREETEWVETIQSGWNRLWSGPDYTVRKHISDYGTGNSAQQIAEVLQHSLI